MTDRDQTRPAGCPRWLRWLLGVSLALNLAVLGLGIGAALRFHDPDRMPPPRSVATALIREMPEERRQALRERAFVPHADPGARRREDAQEVSAALKTVPFDAATLRAVLVRHGDRRAAFQVSVLDAWLDQVLGMTDAERAAYAGRLERAIGRDRHDRDRRHDD